MKRLCYALFVILFAAASVSAQQQSAADSLAGKARENYNAGRYQETRALFEQALPIYLARKDTAGWLSHAFTYAEVLVDLGQYELALQKLREIEAVNHPYKDPAYNARIYNDFGWAYSKKGMVDEAESSYKKALRLAKTARDTSEIALVLGNLGSIMADKEDYAAALSYHKQGHELKKKRKDSVSLAISFNNIGYTYSRLDLYKKAESYYRKSLELRKKIGRSDLLLVGYNNLALIQKKQDHLNQALVTYHESLSLAKEYATPDELGSIYNNIGMLYMAMNDHNNALSFLRKALKYKKRSPNPILPLSTMDNLAWCYTAMGKKDSSSVMLNKAQELLQKHGNRTTRVNFYITSANTHFSDQNYRQALSYAQRAYELTSDSSRQHNRMTAQKFLGSSHLELNNLDKAHSHLQTGRKLSRNYSLSDQIFFLQSLARLYRKMDSDSAFYYGDMAIGYIERASRLTSRSAELSARSFSEYEEFYKTLAGWYLEKENKEKAFDLIVSSKARSLNYELYQAQKQRLSSQNDSLLLRKQQLGKDLSHLSRELEMANSEEAKKTIEAKIQETELAYHAVVNSIKDESNYQEVLNPISLQETQALLDEDTGIIEFAVTPSNTLLMLIGHDRMQTISLGDQIGSNQIKEWTEDFRSAIIGQQPVSSLEKESAQIRNNLLSPILNSHLASKESWIIVPDGPLAYLPFEALRHSGRYLIEEYNIKYLPSIQTLKLLQQPRESYPKDILAVASAEFKNNSTNQLVTRRSLYTLPSTLVEVDSITSGYPQTVKLKKSQVTEERIKQEPLNQYRYLHFATHGFFDNQNPMLSRLVLTTRQPLNALSREDGFLHVSEIKSMNIPADMVVLSACNTALGPLVNGEGVMGMQRSFLIAGASTVVVSLWSVFDRSTTVLMNHFYKNLKQSEGQDQESLLSALFSDIWSDSPEASLPFGEKGSALRNAKLNMLNHPVYNHPVYWAPFIVVGR